MVKNLPASVGDAGLIPRSERFPRGGKWQSTLVFLPQKFCGQEEPGGLGFMGSQRVGCDRADEPTHNNC